MRIRSLLTSRHRRAAAELLIALLLGALVGVITTTVRAEVRVDGDVAAVRVDARQASISEVLRALGAAFNVRYRSSAPLDPVLTGTYTGPLTQVISLVLDGYSYVLKKEPEAIEVVVVGRRSQRPVTAETPKLAPNGGLADGTATEKSASAQRPDDRASATSSPSASDPFAPIPLANMTPQLLTWFNLAKAKRRKFVEEKNFSYLELMGKYIQLTTQAAELDRQGRPTDALAKLKEIESIRAIEDIPIPELLAVYLDIYRRLGDNQKYNQIQGLFLGTLQAVAHSGDGLSRDTAVEIIAISEELYWLRSKRLMSTARRLVETTASKYDVVTAKDSAGNSRDYFFNVTGISAMMNPEDAGGSNGVIFGLRLPPEIGGAERGIVADYEKVRPGLGYGVKYLMPAWKVDVYLYDMKRRRIPDDPESDDVRAQLAGARNEISEAAQRGVYDNVRANGDYAIDDKTGRPRFVCSALNYLEKVIATEVDSYICLTGWQNKFFKIRATTARHDSSRAELRRFVEAWIGVLWPSP